MKAIVYASNAGSTARYAKLLAHETGLPVYSVQEVKKQLPAREEILYLGWVRAGGIRGWQEAAKQFRVCAVCGVGMCQTGIQVQELREKNAIPGEIPLFTLQGSFDREKLHGVYKMMMKIMVKSLAQKQTRTPEEEDMLDMLEHGGDRVRFENLKAVLDWYGAGRGAHL